jgi:hypothetical protein
MVRNVRVLIACEYSGVVRDAFARYGHDAWSCDLMPSDVGGKHIQGDVRDVLNEGWDLMIAHPPCTYLASSGWHWTKRYVPTSRAVTGPARLVLAEKALGFVVELMNAPIKRIAIENPIGRINTAIRKPDQIIQPWYFGDDASKATCLWLKNLPRLADTNRLPGDRRTRRANQTASGQNRLGPSPDRWKVRSQTYPGVAEAMASQWGVLES